MTSEEPGDGKRRAVGSECLLRFPAPSFEGQLIVACAKDGRFQPAAIVAAHQYAFQGPKRRTDRLCQKLYERWMKDGEVGRTGGFAPRPPGFSALVPRWVGAGGANGARSRPISAPGSALRSHPCGALSSAPATAQFTPPGLRPPGRARGSYSTGLARW